jgi:hypothetical protein
MYFCLLQHYGHSEPIIEVCPNSVIKLMAYEPVFEARINEVRSSEMSSLRARKYLDAFCVYFWATTPILVSLSTFSMYHLLGNRVILRSFCDGLYADGFI